MIPIEEIDKLLELANGITPGEWELWTGCSWRRIGSSQGESIVEPTKQSDGHPDLWFRQGFNGPDARCMIALPRFVAALRSARDALVQQQWRPIESAPKDGTVVIVTGGVAYWRESMNHRGGPGGWYTITGCDWPGKPIQWEVTHWMPFPKASQ